MAALLFTLLAVLLFSSTQGLNAANYSSSLKLIHVNSPLTQSSDSWVHSLLQTQSNDKARQQYLSSLVAGRKTVVPISSWSNTYVVEAMIGTPPQKLRLALDTNTDVGLVKCSGCSGASCHNTFNTRSSSTFKRFRCGAKQCNQVPTPSCRAPNCWLTTWYNNFKVEAELVQDKIGPDSFDYTFGCAFGRNSLLAQGLLGLGRGQLSLLSQTSRRYKSTFSYCLPSFNSNKPTGSLKLGPWKQPKMPKTTPLLTNYDRQSLHIVNLVAIVVDNKAIYVSGGYKRAIVDTGTVFTSLVWNAYRPMRDHVRNLMSREGRLFKMGELDTCYKKSFKALTITFMFDGMNMTLPMENIITRVGSLNCLAMAPTPNNINSGLNIIASFQQQNFRVIINANSLGVVPERCTRA